MDFVRQFLIGTSLVVLSVILSALLLAVLDAIVNRTLPWLLRPPRGLKRIIVMVLVVMFGLVMIIMNVLLWSTFYYQSAIFGSVEESLYFALITFTTVGFGDVVLPEGTRILSGLTAINGVLNIGIISAALLENMRRVTLPSSNGS